MASATTVAVGRSRQSVLGTTTVQQFTRAGWVAVALVALGCVLYAAEKLVIQPASRCYENPVEVVMRALATGHFLVGWMYLLTSPRLRNRPSLIRLAGATLAGLGLCWIFATFGATKNPWLVMIFYGSFLVHEVRDEAQIYLAYGNAPPMSDLARRALAALGHAACLLLMTTLAAGFLGASYLRGVDGAMARWPGWVPWAVLAFLGMGCLATVGRAVHFGREVHGGFGNLLRIHAPLAAVYAGIFVILLAGSLLGSTGFNLIILLHVCAWLVFVAHQLDKKPRPDRLTPWQWLRGTPEGFLSLHLGIMVVALALMAVRVHVWGRVGIASEILASGNFCYWSLMHIAMSFWSSK